jgi:hypothetical protein
LGGTVRRLIQVGATTWVDPDTIQAIEWSAYLGHCPKLLLASGQYVYASKWRDVDDANGEAKTGELIAWLLACEPDE